VENAAIIRIGIGEISRELEKAEPIRGDLLPTVGKKIGKAETLAAAGISTRTTSDGDCNGIIGNQ
jgi:hypothetical protein